MGDYNWFSDDVMQVATNGLRAEARKWHGLADRMSAVSAAAAGQGLSPLAFSVLVDEMLGTPVSGSLQHAYQVMFDWLNALFKQAAVEFDAMGDALKKNADWYEHADANSAQNFDSIATS